MASGTPGGSVVSSFDSSLSVILNKKEKKREKKKARIYEIPTEVRDRGFLDPNAHFLKGE